MNPNSIIDAVFALLVAAIARHGVARVPGETPDTSVGADEFMYMQHAEGCFQFKHVRSRNYVFVQGTVEPDGFHGHLIVPAMDRPFLQGHFPKD